MSTSTQGIHEVTMALTDSQYQKLQAYAKAQGFDSVAQLTLDFYQDIYVLD